MSQIANRYYRYYRQRKKEMVLTNSYGVRISRCSASDGRAMASQFGGGRFGYSSQPGDTTGAALGRVTDVRLAKEAARAAFRGNPVTIGLNEGVVGLGGSIKYQPASSVGDRWVLDTVDKFVMRTKFNTAGGPLSHFDGDFRSEADLASDILRILRRTTFRVIAFADHWADRRFSTIHKQNIHYTVSVSPALTHVPVGTETWRVSNPCKHHVMYDSSSCF